MNPPSQLPLTAVLGYGESGSFEPADVSCELEWYDDNNRWVGILPNNSDYTAIRVRMESPIVEVEMELPSMSASVVDGMAIIYPNVAQSDITVNFEATLSDSSSTNIGIVFQA